MFIPTRDKLTSTKRLEAAPTVRSSENIPSRPLTSPSNVAAAPKRGPVIPTPPATTRAPLPFASDVVSFVIVVTPSSVAAAPKRGPVIPTPPATTRAPLPFAEDVVVPCTLTSPPTSRGTVGEASFIPTLEVLTSTNRLEAPPTVKSSPKVVAPVTFRVSVTVILF